jgi:N-acetyl-anhydromuramyl-L-alanine amidase AmpD
MIDPALNQQVLDEIQTRTEALDAIIADPNTSAAAKAEAKAAKEQLAQEKALRQKVASAKTDAQKQKAERDLQAFRDKTCPDGEEGSSVATCRPTVVFVHIHMRFLLPEALLLDLRDTGKYPLRVKNCPPDTFKKRYSFEGMSIPSKKRWSGDHPVVNATVKLGEQTATTNRSGTAKFEDVGAGTYTLEITPPPDQDTTSPAGPDLPVRTGYVYADAPMYKYRPFTVSATIDDDGRWVEDPAASVTLPHKGAYADYAGVAGVSNMDLYLDWKPDWLKIPNRETGTRTNSAVVMHMTATTLHEQIGSPIDTFHGGAGTAAHYLVDLDGHIVKLVHEEERCAHAAASHWHELNGLNTHGIGIETVHTDSNTSSGDGKLREFPAEQYAAINRLVTNLRTTFDIDKAYVCGHNDCRDGARDCPGDMFDWKSLEDAGNALRTVYGGEFEGTRSVRSQSQTADDAAIPMSQELYKVGYTNKTVETALSRFRVRAFSGSRYDLRPAASLEAIPKPKKGAPPPTPQEGEPPPPPVVRGADQQVTQPIADALDQMYRDL